MQTHNTWSTIPTFRQLMQEPLLAPGGPCSLLLRLVRGRVALLVRAVHARPAGARLRSHHKVLRRDSPPAVGVGALVSVRAPLGHVAGVQAPTHVRRVTAGVRGVSSGIQRRELLRVRREAVLARGRVRAVLVLGGGVTAAVLQESGWKWLARQ